MSEKKALKFKSDLLNNISLYFYGIKKQEGKDMGWL